jgi:hypothetical protein
VRWDRSRPCVPGERDRVVRREDPDCADAAPSAGHGSPEMGPRGGRGLGACFYDGIGRRLGEGEASREDDRISTRNPPSVQGYALPNTSLANHFKYTKFIQFNPFYRI